MKYEIRYSTLCGRYIDRNKKRSARRRTRAKKKYVAKATALGARSSQANFFLVFYRKLRSYEIKNAPLGSHSGGVEDGALRPAAGGESSKAGFFVLS